MSGKCLNLYYNFSAWWLSSDKSLELLLFQFAFGNKSIDLFTHPVSI